MKTVLVAILLSTSACSNLSGYSAEYKAVHNKVFWSSLSGGGMDGSAQAWANLKAHEAAEKQVGK